MPRNFEDDPRRKHELAMRSSIDSIYRQCWPGCQIKRFDHSDDAILDIKYGIDVEVKMSNGMVLLGQEKALQYRYRTHRTVTVEYWNDPITKTKPGDWFHLASQFYFCGYATADGKMLDPWVLLDWMQVVEATRRGEINWGLRDNSKTNALANFKFVKMKDLPPQTILFSKGLEATKQVVRPFVHAPQKPNPDYLRAQLRAMSDFDRLVLLSEMLAETVEVAKKKKRAA